MKVISLVCLIFVACMVLAADPPAELVPLDVNAALMKSRYAALGGEMELLIAPGQGHTHWEGFFRCRELVEFVEKHTVAKLSHLVLALPIMRVPIPARSARYARSAFASSLPSPIKTFRGLVLPRLLRTSIRTVPNAPTYD